MPGKLRHGNPTGHGGARKGAGRPADEVRDLFKGILERSGAHERLERILKETTDNETFLKAYQLSADRAWGKAAQSVEHSGEIGHRIINITRPNGPA